MMKVAAGWRWVRGHKRRTAALLAAVLLSGYVVVYVVVSLHRSSTDQYVTLHDGRRLAYERWAGDGVERVILVHGSPADAASWGRLKRSREALGAREVIVIDRLGYGNSTHGDELSLEAHARSLGPLLEEVDGRKPILVGHSYGGPVVLRAAVAYSDRLGGVVLAAGACDPYMRDSIWFRRAVDFISIVVPREWSLSNRELLALTDENRAMENELERVTCPVVVLHGEWDPVCPHDGTVKYLRSRLVNSDVTIVSLQHTGHNIHLTHPQQIANAIWELVER